MTTFSAAIAGTGFMGAAHAEALGRVGVTVTGILGSSPEKSRQAAAALQLPRAYQSYEDLLADPAVAEKYRDQLTRLIDTRLSITVGGVRQQMQWTGIETLPERQSVRLTFRLGAGRIGSARAHRSGSTSPRRRSSAP